MGFSDYHFACIHLFCRKSAIERLAQNTFTDVGNILQKRRMADFAENSGCHLTDSVRSERTEKMTEFSFDWLSIGLPKTHCQCVLVVLCLLYRHYW